VHWLGIDFPRPISKFLYAVKNFGPNLRNSVVRSLPGAIVNNSSNFIAATQLVGEMMMFKANGTQFVPTEHRATWWRYLVEPPKSIYKSVFEKAGGGGLTSLTEIFTPRFYQKSNLPHASALDSLNHQTALINRWQARSTFAGLVGMLLSAVFPDVKDSQEDLEKRTELAYNRPFRYVAQTVGEALWFPVATVLELGKRGVAKVRGEELPETMVGKYKRQFTGLGILIAGTCSFLSGFRNVKGQLPHQTYAHNPAHSIGGAITAFAGANLLLSVGSDQGWARFGSIQWLRMAFLPKSISHRYKADSAGRLDGGRHWYFGGQGALQTTNTLSYLIGGAEKRDDGTIIDHKTVRDTIRAEVKSKRALAKASHNLSAMPESAQPSTSISSASGAALAMPERLEAANTSREAAGAA